MFYLFFALFICVTQIKAMEPPIPTAYEGIKAGIEIEITKPFKYVPLEGEKGLRHKRLLDVKAPDGKLLFWVEVDSSNKDIEIVTPPFGFPAQWAILAQTLNGIDKFLKFLKEIIDPVGNNTEVSVDAANLINLNEKLSEIYLVAEIIEPFKILIEKKEALLVRPQLSFQIPLRSVKRFFTYYLEPEKEKFFSDQEKLIITSLNNEEKSTDGLANLIIYYLENLKLKAKEQNKDFHKNLRLVSALRNSLFREPLVPSLPDNLSPLENFHQLLAASSLSKVKENYVRMHKLADIRELQETGLKRFFPIMSRIAFSDIYNLIKSSVNRGRLERLVRDRYIDWHTPIVFPSYSITKNPLYKVEAIQPSDFYYPYKNLKTSILNYNFTIAKWFESIVAPQDSEPRPLRARVKDLARMSKGLAKQNLTLKGFEDMSSFSAYLRDVMFPVNNGKDLMSPPAFTSYDDSMGALDIKKLDPSYGEVVLEVRRYTNFFKSHSPELLGRAIFLEIDKVYQYLFN